MGPRRVPQVIHGAQVLGAGLQLMPAGQAIYVREIVADRVRVLADAVRNAADRSQAVSLKQNRRRGAVLRREEARRELAAGKTPPCGAARRAWVERAVRHVHLIVPLERRIAPLYLVDRLVAQRLRQRHEQLIARMLSATERGRVPGRARRAAVRKRLPHRPAVGTRHQARTGAELRVKAYAALVLDARSGDVGHVEPREPAVERHGLRLALELVVAEEVRPVLPDGAAERRAVLLIRVI